MRRIAAVAAVGLALLVASCGGSDPEASKPTTPSTVAGASAGGAGGQKAWQAVLDELRVTSRAPGAVAAVDRGGTRWDGVSGAADTAGGKLDGSTRFRIASVTKIVTAALVLDAVADGRLGLDDRVSTLAPGLVSVSDDITVRMLLDHTSGLFAEGDEGDLAADIGRLTNPALRAEASALAAKFVAGEPVAPSVPLLVALAETHGLYAPPGAGYHYSNVNYLVAGAMLEKVAGTTLAELLRTQIVEPLSLRRTTLAPADEQAPPFTGYAVAADGTLADPGNAYLLLLGNGASGGVISTAGELLTMVQAIVRGQVGSPALAAEMVKPSAPSGSAAYGLGIARYSLSCGTFYGHEGAIDGTSAIAIVSRSGTDGVVLALNARGDGDPGLPTAADRILCGER